MDIEMRPEMKEKIARLLYSPEGENETAFIARFFREGRKYMDTLTDPAERVQFSHFCADFLEAPRQNMFMLLTRRAKYPGEL